MPLSKTPFLTCLLIAVAVLAAGPAAAHQPPANLHLVGDHWTAWNPPAPPEGIDVHVVAKGDTLWDLAQRFYGDPYLWPQIWERNRWVEDAHWIYPGDPLVLGVEIVPIEELAAQGDMLQGDAGGGTGVGDGAGDEDRFSLDRSVGPPVALGSSDDIHCSGFIGAVDEAFDRRIIGSEFENLAPRLSKVATTAGYGTVDAVKLDLSTGDIVYVDGGAAAGVYPGSIYTVISPREVIAHPVSRKDVGRFYRYLGRVRILSVQEETAIGEISHSCHPTLVGSLLREFEPEPVPLARRLPMRGVNDPSRWDSFDEAPVIVRSVEGIVTLGQDHVVFIDRGAEHDVVPGDIYTIYRMNAPGIPPVVIGELGILSVDGQTSLAKILESRYSIHVGDRLESRAR